MFHQEIKYGKLFHCLARKMFKIIIIIKPRNLKLKKLKAFIKYCQYSGK